MLYTGHKCLNFRYHSMILLCYYHFLSYFLKKKSVPKLSFKIMGQLGVCLCRQLWQRAACPCWTALPCWPLRLRPASTCCMWATMMSAPLWSRSTAMGAAAPHSALNSTGMDGQSRARFSSYSPSMNISACVHSWEHVRQIIHPDWLPSTVYYRGLMEILIYCPWCCFKLFH